MAFLLDFASARFPQKPRGCSVRLVHNFVKQATIPAVDSKLYLRANRFVFNNGLGALRDERLKKDHPIGVTLPSLYAVDLH